MIPYPYNMVDMGGIDLAEANCTVVDGLYAKIVEAVNACGDTVLYNWKFASIEIAPQHTQILLGDGVLTINTLIQVTEQDVVTVLGIAPPPPPVVPVEPLTVYENGVYEATPPASGFNPVNVAVPSAVLVPLSVTENGEYEPIPPASGFNSVTVDVPVAVPSIYTNIGSGVYAPYGLAVDSSRQVALIGSTTYIKNNNTEVYAAVCQSSLGYKAILLACPVENHVQEDTRFSPGGTGTGTRTVGGVNYYYSWATGISGDYNQGPAKWSDITGSSWDQILNLLFSEIVKTYNVPAPAYNPGSTGFIPVPEGYDGFGPLFII